MNALTVFENWADQGQLRRLDAAMAHWLAKHDPSAPDAMLWAVAWLTHREGQGHTGVPLAELHLPPADWPAEALAQWQLLMSRAPADSVAWQTLLSASPLVGNLLGHSKATTPTPKQALVIDGPPNAPLLYWQRYWRYEQAVADGLLTRAAQRREVDEARARPLLAALFALPAPAAPASTSQTKPAMSQEPSKPPLPRDAPDWQCLACALALRSGLTLITGGPGTGKTYTAARLLALLAALSSQAANGAQSHDSPHTPPLQLSRIALAAPTGKAAARLRLSIEDALVGLQSAVGDAINLTDLVQRIGPAKTLHALLGMDPQSRRSRHHAGHPLPVDVLIVDETSMVHVELMATLLAALPAHAQLILLGDKDQLASVEAGAVMGDLCRTAPWARYDADTRDYLTRLTGQAPDVVIDQPEPHCPPHPLESQTVMLRTSRRFGGQIGQWALAINEGRWPPARPVQASLFEDDTASSPAVCWHGPEVKSQLIATLVHGRPGAEGGFAPYLQALQRGLKHPPPDHDAWVREVLAHFDAMRVLCAVHEGPWGVDALNNACIAALEKAGLLRPEGQWYPGRPVMVTSNDPALGVFNGDVGVVLPPPPSWGHPPNAWRVYFQNGTELHSVAVGRLNQVATCFAMTVHKSQGSEFAHTVLVLPDRSAVGRELVYTGVTRAKTALTLVAPNLHVLEKAVQSPTERTSGLLHRLSTVTTPHLLC